MISCIVCSVNDDLHVTCQISLEYNCLSTGEKERVGFALVFESQSQCLDCVFWIMSSAIKGEVVSVAFGARNIVDAVIVNLVSQTMIRGSVSGEIFASACASHPTIL